jgi:hypothetical protein
METLYPRTEGKNPPTVEKAFSKITKQELKESNWPILTKVKKKTFQNYNGRFDVPTHEREKKREMQFWKEFFSKDNFISKDKVSFNPEEDVLFVLHSFKNTQGMDSEFVAVTTNYRSFIDDPINLINYELHGRPCSVRSHGSYPRKDFWDFYDDISEKEQNEYVIPDTKWREHYYTNGD